MRGADVNHNINRLVRIEIGCGRGEGGGDGGDDVDSSILETAHFVYCRAFPAQLWLFGWDGVQILLG